MGGLGTDDRPGDEAIEEEVLMGRIHQMLRLGDGLHPGEPYEHEAEAQRRGYVALRVIDNSDSDVAEVLTEVSILQAGLDLVLEGVPGWIRDQVRPQSIMPPERQHQAWSSIGPPRPVSSLPRDSIARRRSQQRERRRLTADDVALGRDIDAVQETIDEIAEARRQARDLQEGHDQRLSDFRQDFYARLQKAVQMKDQERLRLLLFDVLSREDVAMHDGAVNVYQPELEAIRTAMAVLRGL